MRQVVFPKGFTPAPDPDFKTFSLEGLAEVELTRDRGWNVWTHGSAKPIPWSERELSEKYQREIPESFTVRLQGKLNPFEYQHASLKKLVASERLSMRLIWSLDDLYRAVDDPDLYAVIDQGRLHFHERDKELPSEVRDNPENFVYQYDDDSPRELLNQPLVKLTRTRA